MSHTNKHNIAAWLEGLSLQPSPPPSLDVDPPQTPEKQIQVQRIGLTGTDSRDTSPTDTHFSDVFDSPEPWGWGGAGVRVEGEGDDDVQTEASSYESLEQEDEQGKNDGAGCARIIISKDWEGEGRFEHDIERGEENSPGPPLAFESAFAENYPKEDRHEQETAHSDPSTPREQREPDVCRFKTITRHDSVHSSPSSPTPDTSRPTPKKTHIIVTSCLQCTLMRLPCSCTLPHCTRCARNGHASLCLAQRRKLTSEMVDGDVVGNQEPVLVRLRGEGAEKWEEKCRVYYMLLQTYRRHLDRQNWVLPSVSTPRGTYRTHGQRLLRLHPGQGIGRLTFAEVELGDEAEDEEDSATMKTDNKGDQENRTPSQGDGETY